VTKADLTTSGGGAVKIDKDIVFLRNGDAVTQPFTKTDAGMRVVPLPASFIAKMRGYAAGKGDNERFSIATIGRLMRR
jgi:hypothetical protein